MSNKKILPWIKTLLDNNNLISADTFFKLSDLFKQVYFILRPVVDSASVSKVYLGDKIDSDFKYKRFYNSDVVVNPEHYFRYNFGVVIIELVFVKGSFSVRAFNYEFDLESLKLGWFSKLSGKLFDISFSFQSGYAYYGSFERKNFSIACEFFQFLVRCFQDKCLDISLRNFIHFSDNPKGSVL